MRAATWGVGAILAIAFLGGDEDGVMLTFPQLLALAVLPPVAASWCEGWWRERVAHVERLTQLMTAAVKAALESSDESEDEDDAEDA